MATIVESAKHLDLSERRFMELLEAGILERQDRGRYELDTVRVAYIRHLRQRAAGAGERSSADMEKARDEARLAKARADKAEMEAAEMRGLLVRADQVEEVWMNALVNTKTRLAGIPARTAHIVLAAASNAAAEKILRREVGEALHELDRADPCADLDKS